MSAIDIFEFLNDLYDNLPDADRERFAELWTAYEQTYGDIWSKLLESKLASNIDYVPLYNIRRWLKHTFDSTTAVSRKATFRTNQDLSKGVDLTFRYFIRVSINGSTPIEIDLRGNNPSVTLAKEVVDKINTAAGFPFSKLVENNSLILFASNVSGTSSSLTFYPASDSSKDAAELILGLGPSLLPITYPKYPYIYQLLDTKIVSIPKLQDKIHEELITTTLTEGDDYEIEFDTGVILFKNPPPLESFWAKNTFVNLETPYNNFGYLIDIYDKNTPSYLKSVKGLWLAFWTGPRPINIRRSLYLLFGLPTASTAGIVTGLTPTTITLTYTNGTVETFTIPVDLESEVVLGQSVTRFQPLVNGITVMDKINSPGFLAREAGRPGIEPFLTERATRGEDLSTDESKALTFLEENTYLPQIDVNSFVRPDINLANVRSFLRNIQPKSRTFLLQVLVGNFDDPLPISEGFGQDFSLDPGPNFDFNQTTYGTDDDRLDAEEYPSGTMTIYSSTGPISVPNSGTLLDSEGIAVADYLDIEVYQGAVLVDSFAVEG